MTKRCWSRIASTVVAGGMLLLASAAPVTADHDEIEIMVSFAQIIPGTSVGASADGSVASPETSAVRDTASVDSGQASAGSETWPTSISPMRSEPPSRRSCSSTALS